MEYVIRLLENKIRTAQGQAHLQIPQKATPQTKTRKRACPFPTQTKLQFFSPFLLKYKNIRPATHRTIPILPTIHGRHPITADRRAAANN